jgi:hypothetical protein
MFRPKHLYKLALKCICCYLKQTSDPGMRMSPSSDVCKIDAYPNADFAGMYGHEEHTDPACAKSCTRFIITFAECPVLWQSKKLTEMALSTMEAKVIALPASCRELFPIIDMVSSLTKSINLPIGKITMNVSIHEDIWELWSCIRLCHLSSRPKANVMQSRPFGFVKRFSRKVSNFLRSTLSNN